MSTNALYILGNSDLYINGVSYARKQHFSDMTRFIWENIEKFEIKKGENFFLLSEEGVPYTYIEEGEENAELIKEIKFPIFATFLLYITKKRKSLPDRMLLFVTKQNPLHEKDTYYLGQILRYILEGIFYHKNRERILLTIVEENPSDYELMGSYFSNFLEANKELLNIAAFNFVQVATGTPAMTFNLSLALSSLANANYLYASNTQKGVKIEEIRYFKILDAKRYINLIKRLLDVYEYPVAISVFRGSPLRSLRVVDDLLNIMKLRRELRFREALDMAKPLISLSFPGLVGISYGVSNKEHGIDLSFVAEYLSDILTNRNLMIWASFEEMQIYMDRKEYHIALASYFNVMENLTAYLITDLGEDLENLKHKDGKYFSYPDKVSWLKKRIKEENKDDKFPYKLLFDKEFELLEQKLREKRNKGPLAHGFLGLEEEDKGMIEKIEKKLCEALYLFSPALSELKRKNFYKYMNEVIHAYLEKAITYI